MEMLNDVHIQYKGVEGKPHIKALQPTQKGARLIWSLDKITLRGRCFRKGFMAAG